MKKEEQKRRCHPNNSSLVSPNGHGKRRRGEGVECWARSKTLQRDGSVIAGHERAAEAAMHGSGTFFVILMSIGVCTGLHISPAGWMHWHVGVAMLQNVTYPAVPV